MSSKGKEIYGLIKDLFPFCRSITGDGVRKTLQRIKKQIPINIVEIPSGKKVFDWVVPNEWNIKDAYVKDAKGKKIIDFHKSNLHVVSYSVPFQGQLSLEKLKKHLYSLPDQPDAIPYITSYYEKRWGFCLTHNDFKKLRKGTFTIKMDTSLAPGHMTYADLLIKGQTKNEILFSTYICHPSMANNELSGPALATYLAQHLKEKKGKHYYSYRFVFVPETIGSIAYISKNISQLRRHVHAGYVLTCAGDNGLFSYLKTRADKTVTNKVSLHVLENFCKKFNVYEYLERGSDERQYNSPGVDLPIGSLMRSKYHEYPEYHTSKDNLKLVSPKGLGESFDIYLKCIDAFENNFIYQSKFACEPQLSKRGLYPSLSTKDSYRQVKISMDFLAYCDGHNDVIDIAEKIKMPIWDLYSIINTLKNNNIISRKKNNEKNTVVYFKNGSIEK